MKRADLQAELYSAASGVRQAHLDRVQALGVSTATIANLCGRFGAFGVTTVSDTWAGLYQPGPGPLHIVQPVVMGGELVDLVAWHSLRPDRWHLRSGLGWLLGAADAFDDSFAIPSASLHETPLDWLRGGGAGSVVLDWQAPELRDLLAMESIECASPALAAMVRDALSRPSRLPAIRVKAVRNVAGA